MEEEGNFRQKISRFIVESEQELDSFEKKCKSLHEQCQESVEYLGEGLKCGGEANFDKEPEKVSPEEVFKILAQFFATFEKAIEENKRDKEIEEKRQKKEVTYYSFLQNLL